jgi:hypothetical protein
LGGGQGCWSRSRAENTWLKRSAAVKERLGEASAAGAEAELGHKAVESRLMADSFDVESFHRFISFHCHWGFAFFLASPIHFYFMAI